MSGAGSLLSARPHRPSVAREKGKVNLAAEDSRIMKDAGGGFDQCYNAQAVVAAGNLLIVAPTVTQVANDNEQLIPMIAKLQALPNKLGRTRPILAYSEYLSQSDVEQCAAARINPLIACGDLANMSSGTSALRPQRNPHPNRLRRCKRWRIG